MRHGLVNSLVAVKICIFLAADNAAVLSSTIREFVGAIVFDNTASFSEVSAILWVTMLVVIVVVALPFASNYERRQARQYDRRGY